MKLSMSKTREQFPLSIKKVLKKTIVSSLGWFVILIIGFIFMIGIKASTEGATIYLGSILFSALIIFLVILSVIYFYQKWYYSVYFYDLTDDFIIIKKGPITPHEITIPYERVQDVYVDQDLLDRFFGIYDVHLSSATFSSGLEAHIDGVEKAAADGLRDSLLKTVQQKITKNRQPLNS